MDNLDAFLTKLVGFLSHENSTISAVIISSERKYVKIGTVDIASVNNVCSRLSLVTHYVETDGALGAGSDTITYTCLFIV